MTRARPRGVETGGPNAAARRTPPDIATPPKAGRHSGPSSPGKHRRRARVAGNRRETGRRHRQIAPRAPAGCYSGVIARRPRCHRGGPGTGGRRAAAGHRAEGRTCRPDVIAAPHPKARRQGTRESLPPAPVAAQGRESPHRPLPRAARRTSRSPPAASAGLVVVAAASPLAGAGTHPRARRRHRGRQAGRLLLFCRCYEANFSVL